MGRDRGVYVRFQTKLMVLVGSLLLCVIGVLVVSFQYMTAITLRQQIGERALNIAQTVATIPDIRHAFSQPNPSKIIQPIAESIQRKTGAEFVVVGNQEGIRYSHPVSNRIGKEMEGGDDRDVLEKGESIIEQAVGTLGPSLRGKTPIYNQNGQIIGIVSVGFLTKEVDTSIALYRDRIIVLGGIALLIGVIGTFFVSRRVKQDILGLEPEEIGRLYQEKRAILTSIREGIVAIDASRKITLVNQTACRLFGLPSESDIIGQPIEHLAPSPHLLRVVQTGEPAYDEQVMISNQVVVANTVPVVNQRGETIGAVSSFRNKSELNRLSAELSQVRTYADALRAQTHEYSNKLYTISGLVQLERYQEAIQFITRESDVHQNLIRFVMDEIPDPMIGGLILGKFNRAQELKVTFELNRESSFRDVPQTVDRDGLITIIGNLIDNAIEAVLSPTVTDKKVSVFLTDLGKDLVIEVEDCGVGIPDEYEQRIFDMGFSTKSEKNHGFGLALVKKAVDALHGQITFTGKQGCGTIFTVVIPKGYAVKMGYDV
ncbi:sensor histidine kinase [Alicyclobacillus acidoterrestris]|uniref:histidine kinase n=1 Tax=Alicyclobacillus acidoterrestris (strain ATCC 49025 / DSM 3922 / CIP 106132 / NCIMB 13137 / GD3B) TaxID=1356854 RepID=T0BS48_ALIAG|nr:sensor histidine kinase [Alicyclobacillus acidoterrestris]EPZ43584.1 hypothetical protein N007_12810 [Alicyclobacillus acidoterrestris ATCC 49025]UNO50262.1 sensor histidine kinase [Alicyclobacillus acidoterrestris]